MTPAAHESVLAARAVLHELARLRPAKDLLADAKEELARLEERLGPATVDIRRQIAIKHYRRLPAEIVHEAVEVVAALRELGGWSNP